MDAYRHYGYEQHEAWVSTLVLGRFLSRSVGADEYVGVMLPPTVAGSVANLNQLADANSGIDIALVQSGITT